MQTTSIRAMFRLDGRIHAEILVEVKETDERFAYEIKKDHNGTLYCDMDGSRYDLTEHEIRKLNEMIRELKKEKEQERVKEAVPPGTRRGTGRSKRSGRKTGH